MALYLEAIVKAKNLPNQKNVGEAIKAAMRAVTEHAHRHFRPRHFEVNARNRYRYRQRSFKYRQRKERLAAKGKVKKGGKADLVFSGELEAAAEAPPTIRVTGNRAVASNFIPNYARFHGKLLEIERTTLQERNELNAVADKKIQEVLNVLTRS